MRSCGGRSGSYVAVYCDTTSKLQAKAAIICNYHQEKYATYISTVFAEEGRKLV